MPSIYKKMLWIFPAVFLSFVAVLLIISATGVKVSPAITKLLDNIYFYIVYSWLLVLIFIAVDTTIHPK